MSQPPPAADPAGPQRRLRTRWLDAQLQPFRGRHRLALACTVAAGVLWVPQAAAIAWLLDAVLSAGLSPAAVRAPLLLLAVTLALRVAVGWLGQRVAAGVAEGVLAHLRVSLASAAFARGPLWMRGQRSGGLVALSTSHVDATAAYYTGYLPARAEVALVPLAILLAVFSVDWIVGLLLLVTAPLAPVFMMLIGMGAEAAGRSQLAALARAGAHFTDRLRGLDLIRVYGRGEAELAEVAEATDSIRERSLRVLRIAFLSSAVLEFFASVSVALIAVYFGFSYLGMLDLRGVALPLSAGLFCLLLAPEFYAPMRRLAAHYHDRANALAAAAEIEAVFGGLPGSTAVAADDDRVPRAAHPAPAVALRGVDLRHPGARMPVLRAIDLEVPAGARLALVGPSGVGKSTLLEAMAGWLAPEAGMLERPPGIRIALAGQRPWLFHGSIADNLRIADPGASDAQLAEVARIAQVAQFAARLPQGLDTVIGERGFGLSGGEARRVALARALLRRPDLLLLDEPTAFLDPDTEAALLAALDAYLAGRTVVVATHSPAVMDWVDRVWTVPAPAQAEGAAA
ncbi:thiol reductant ABC exporter subunit CydD [Luteimonas sp. BDR2-5]|uniref:thiol reductant ABC exporter subunit CydD n=1 Tax=Proluteimonas luteida TaxID=2878685 RepID=UPI001E33BA2D|nr:thiol reductant ABC exporter subunit CydD [Luteimonas sp. BDR2-5]MCD9029592.1 thiol reductant ABC exporter subunit CydD [Luteimonas sp. BDR2-5]